MMAPEVYEEARAKAAIHLQLLRMGDASSGLVSGRVVRIFRDRDRVLHLGQRISFDVPVRAPAGSAPPVPSGVIYHDGERLDRARWLEAFLDSWQGEIHLVHSQVAPIRHPTWRPVCGADTKGFVCPGNT